MKFELVAVKPFEIPVEILKQKDQWDLRLFYEIAIDCTNWFGFLVQAEGETVAAFILEANPLYSDVNVGTLIIDQEHRTREMQELVYNAARSAAQTLAQKLEFATISFSTFRPKFVNDILSRSPEGVKRRRPRVSQYIMSERTWPHG